MIDLRLNLMKKIWRSAVLAILIAVLLSTSFALGASDNAQAPLDQRLLGTWRWEYQHSWIVVFREDGTLLDGPPILRTTYSWQVVNDRLIVDGVDWNIRFTGDTFTVDRYGRNSYTYVWYSASTEGETSYLFFFILLGVLGVIVFVVVLIIVLSARKRRRKREVPPPQTPAWDPARKS